MTSSFQNVVGTPRDAVPDISKTNYLETAPDMTEAVNAQIDENIKDTKQFFDQMVELELMVENNTKVYSENNQKYKE